MYKTTFLSHLARAGRQHPFFSQNVNSANSTVLSLVKPKVGIATERAYFSSWGGSGSSASNASGSSTSQTALIAVSNDDNNLWEKDLGLHRKQFRAIAGIRRYSTGTRTESESVEGGSLRLTGAPDVVDDAPKLATEDTIEPQEPQRTEVLPEGPRETSSSMLTEFDRHLRDLYQSESYVRLCQDFAGRIEEGMTLTTDSFNTFFSTLDKLNRPENWDARLPKSFLGPDRLLHFYGIMLENRVQPDQKTFETLLEFLLWIRLSAREQNTVLKRCSFLENTLQEAFLEPNRAALAALETVDSTSVALQIFNASIGVRDQNYSIELIESLLSACIPEGRVDDAVVLYDYIERNQLPKTLRTYSSLMEVFIKAKDITGAIECFNTWKKNCRNIPPHDFWSIYNSMVRCYFEVGNEKAALKFFESALTQTDQAKARPIHNVVVCYASQGEYEKARDFAQKYLSRSEYDISRSLAEIVNAACINGDNEAARTYFKDVKSLSAFAKVPMASWNYLAALLIDGQLDEMKTYIRRCVRHQIGLRVAHLSLLISRYFDAGRVEDALEIAGYLGDRRAVWDPNEMNKNKVALFNDLFITEVLQRNLLDAKSLPAIVNIVHMFSKPSQASTLLKFLTAVQKGDFSDVLADDRSTSNLLCRIVMDLEHHVRGVDADTDDEALIVSVRNVVSWMIDVLTTSKASAGGPNFTSGTVEQLKNFAQYLGLEIGKQDLSSSDQTSASDIASQDQAPQPLPFSRDVFLSEFHPSVDRLVCLEVSKAIRSADAKLSNKGRFEAKLPYSQIMASFKDSCTEGHDQILHPDIFFQAFAHFGRAGDAENARELMPLAIPMIPKMIQSDECLPGAQALFYDAAILLFNNLHDSATAQTYHDHVLQLGFIPSANAYASFIAKMDENEYRDSAARALDLFNEARRLGVKPTEYLFNTVIAKLAKARRNDDALTLFQEMKAIGLVPNGVTYGTIINSCCRVGHTAQAEELFSEMEQHPRNQNRIAPYNTLIQHFVQTNKDREKAFFYWDKLLARAIPPTAHTYRLLIEAHGHLSPVDPVAAESVIGLMQANGVQITSIHHAAIIHMYGVVLHDMAAAKRYFDFWSRSRTRPDDVIFQSIIEAAVRNKDIVEMQSLLNRMQAQRVPLNAYIVNLAIEGYSLVDQLDQARELFDSLPTSGAGIRGKEPSTYETMIKAYNAASESEKSLEILDLLKTQHYPDAIVNRASALTLNATS